MRYSCARQRASDGFQSAVHGGSPYSAFQRRIFSMTMSRVSEPFRTPPATSADGVMGHAPFRLAALAQVEGRRPRPTLVEERRRARAVGGHAVPAGDEGDTGHDDDRR